MIEVDIVSFTYPGRSEAALQEIRFEIAPGECVLITGPTGCGKSTLLKCMNGMIPHASEGRLIGDVFVNNRNTRHAPLSMIAEMVGMVQQNPDDQIFSLVVEDEVGFGPENLCLPVEEIDRRIDEALFQVGMAEYRRHRVNALSGGQRQRVVIASILAMQPAVLLLDEPASQLDPKGAREILSVIARISAGFRRSLILVEHRIHEVAHLADRFIIMDHGRVVLDAKRQEVFHKHIDLFYQLGLRLPDTIDLFHRLNLDAMPLTTDDALTFLQEKLKPKKIYRLSSSSRVPVKTGTSGRPSAITMENLWFAYEERNWILKGIDLRIRQGEIIALLGNNGSGKSTLLLQMCGILKPGKGDVSIFGRKIKPKRPEDIVGEVSVVFQDPALMLCCDTVWKETAFGPGNMKIEQDQIEKRVREALTVMTIQDLVDQAPQSLSGGQRLRAAVASVLSMKPRILLLDEPTSGQDRRNIRRFMQHLKTLSNEGITSIFITHDMETALEFAHRMIILDGGTILADGKPADIFSDFDALAKTSLQPPQTVALSAGLGFPPSFCVADLADKIRSGGRP